MNAKSMTASSAAVPVDHPLADQDRLAETRLHLRLRQALRVGPQIEEVERVLGAELGRFLDERALVGEGRDSRTGAHREVVAAVRADPERRLELVVPVVRGARGTRVRVLSRWLWDVPMLDGDVDPG